MNLESSRSANANYGSTKSSDSNDLSKVLIGALVGAAVGSLVAGAFTQKGIEVRTRISDGSKNMAGGLKDKVSNIKGVIVDKYEAAKESAADLIEKGKQKVGILSSTLTDTSNNTYANTEETDEAGAASKILLGALIVSVASSIVWSFATEKGNETRRRIARGSKNVANNIKEKVSDAAGNIADVVSDTYQAAKEGAVDLIEQQKQKTNGGPATSYPGSTAADKW